MLLQIISAAGIFGNIYDNIEDYDFVEKKGVEQGNGFTGLLVCL